MLKFLCICIYFFHRIIYSAKKFIGYYARQYAVFLCFHLVLFKFAFINFGFTFIVNRFAFMTFRHAI